jgi:hypothetical protein
MIYDEYNSINSILDEWNNERLKIFEYLNETSDQNIENIWKKGNISNVNNCECNSNNCLNFLTNKCKGCYFLTRLFIQDWNKDFFIEVDGKYSGNCYSINRTKIGQDTNYKLSNYKLTKFPGENSKELLEKIQMINNCETLFSSIINSTSFFYTKGCFIEHFFVISCIIERYLTLDNFPTIPSVKFLYQCNGSVNTVSKKYLFNKDNFFINLTEEYENSLLIGILLQLTSTLYFLNTKGFIHGLPTFESIDFEEKICNYTYLGKEINCELTLHINPSIFSSINVRNKRLFFNNKQLMKIDNFDSLSIDIKTYLSKNIENKISCTYDSKIPCIDKFKKIAKTCYKIGNNWDIYKKNISMGIPLFHSSFELYSFLISLLKYQNGYFLKILHKNLKLTEVWKQMWIENNYEEVMLNFKNLPNNPSSTDILIFLSNYYLRCDGMNFFMESLN